MFESIIFNIVIFLCSRDCNYVSGRETHCAGMACEHHPWLGPFDMWKKTMKKMSVANQEKRKKALMKEVLSEVDTMVPNYWADDDDSEDNLI